MTKGNDKYEAYYNGKYERFHCIVSALISKRKLLYYCFYIKSIWTKIRAFDKKGNLVYKVYKKDWWETYVKDNVDENSMFFIPPRWSKVRAKNECRNIVWKIYRKD